MEFKKKISLCFTGGKTYLKMTLVVSIILRNAQNVNSAILKRNGNRNA